MTEQLAITLAAAAVGFGSAIFFCIGNTSNTSEKILIEATSLWDFSKPVTSTLPPAIGVHCLRVGKLIFLAGENQ